MASLVLLVAALFSPAAVSAANPTWMLEAKIHGERVEGLPVGWTSDEVHLLARDGRLLDFHPSDAKDFKQTATHFHGYSASEFRDALNRELQNKLEVTGTGHYLVAHPVGQGDKWAERFEDMYRSFVHYFSVRGFRLEEPQFPLVAIVWNKQQDFFHYAASSGTPVPQGVLGFYSPASNRVMLYDSGAKDWKQDASTIVHEATHQTAFNTGVHSRFAMPPRWLAEGLGTLYEARGIWDSRNYPNIEDRINRGRLTNFRQYLAAGRPSGAFLAIVNTDKMFQLNPGAAYAEAWALTFFLQETQSSNYAKYLAKTAARPPFSDYTSAQRLADFRSAFGDDLKMLEANYLRFIAGLK
jgi:Protein of unknown function (DUF1570)